MINYYEMLPQGLNLYFNTCIPFIKPDSTQTADLNTKQMPKPQRKYSVIPDDSRNSLINQVLEEGKSVKQASEATGIKLSTAKAILKTYKTQGRIGKKKERLKRMKKSKKLIEKQQDQSQLLKKKLPKLGQNVFFFPYMYQPPPLVPKVEYQDQVKSENG